MGLPPSFFALGKGNSRTEGGAKSLQSKQSRERIFRAAALLRAEYLSRQHCQIPGMLPKFKNILGRGV